MNRVPWERQYAICVVRNKCVKFDNWNRLTTRFAIIMLLEGERRIVALLALVDPMMDAERKSERPVW